MRIAGSFWSSLTCLSGPMKQQKRVLLHFFHYDLIEMGDIILLIVDFTGKWECCATLHFTITFTHFASATMSMRRKIASMPGHIRATRSRPYNLVTSIQPGCVHA